MNVPAPQGQMLPSAALQARIAARGGNTVLANAVANLGSSRGPYLSIRGGRFRLVAADGSEQLMDQHYIDVIVVDANTNSSRVYFAGEYDPLANEPPACFSDNGTGPSTQAMQPQAPTCVVCPYNVRGSDTTFTGKATTACEKRKKLAIIIPDDPRVVVYEFQVPPGSLSNLKSYSDFLSQQATGVPGGKMDIADVITRIEFDPAKQFVMTFKPIAFADSDYDFQKLQYIVDNKLSDTAVGRNDVAHNPATIGAAPALAAPAPQQNAQFQLPPRQAAAPQQLPPPAAAPAVPPAPQQFAVPPQAPAPTAETPQPRRRGRQPQAQQAPAAPTHAAPFMAPAAAPAPIAPAAPPAQAPSLATPQDLSIPSFLQRTPAAPAAGTPPAPPPARFGVAPATAAPPEVANAVHAAMSLPTRR